MATFEEFLNEKNITIKRRYTDTHPAKTVGHNARVRNKIIEALKDGKLTLDEFNEIIKSNSNSPKRWSRNNKRFFRIEEDGVSLSGYGKKVLKTIQPVNEAIGTKKPMGLTKDETLEVAKKIAEAISKVDKVKCTVNMKTLEEDSFDLDYDGDEFDGGSYMITDDGSVINAAHNGLRVGHMKDSTKDFITFFKKHFNKLAKESVDESLNKSDIAYQLAIDYTGNTKPKITKLNKKRIQIMYGYKINPQTVIDSIKKVEPDVELKHVEWSDKMTGGGFHIFDILESVNEARYDKKKLLKRLGDADDATIQTGDGKEYIIYNPDSNNDDNAEMWHDKSVFAVDQDGDEYEIDYKDIALVMTESVNEAKAPKSWDSQFTMKAIEAYKNGEFDLEDDKSIAEWDKEYNGGRAPKPAFNTKEVVSYAVKTGKKPNGDKMDESVVNESSDLLDRVADIDDVLMYTRNRKAARDWEEYTEDLFADYEGEVHQVAPGSRKIEITWDDMETSDLQTAIDVGQDIMNKYNVKESVVNERAKATQMLKDVAKGFASEVEGIKLSKEMAQAYLDWLSQSAYGRKYNGLPFEHIFKASFNWGIDRYTKNLKGEYEELKQQAKAMKESTIYTEFNQFVNESLVNEALKSSKLRGLISMKKGHHKILKAIYGFSKIQLDKIEDEQIIDIDPKQGKKAEGLVVYYTTQEKENPYADRANNRYTEGNIKIAANTILGLGMGKEVAYMTRHYNKRSGDSEYSLTLNSKKGSDIGINKEYRGWQASGVYNVKRMIDLADGAFVINTAAMPSSKDLKAKRAEARAGATAMMDPKEFKNTNLEKYKAILQQRANELPIDKLVVSAIEDVAKVMSDGIKNAETNQYGEFIMGVGSDGKSYRISDLNNFTNSLMQDYERWARAAQKVERSKEDKEDTWSAKHYGKEMQTYAKDIKDRLAKLKKRNFGW